MMDEAELMRTIYQAIMAALESCLYRIGATVEGEARHLTLEEKIYDQGDFYNNIGYLVAAVQDGLTLTVGSRVRHEPFVLGGKVPSWTPIEPLKAWVERKHLQWVDRKTGAQLTIEQIAYLIRGKIRREGIAARNIFANILDNRESWIFEQLNNLQVTLP